MKKNIWLLFFVVFLLVITIPNGRCEFVLSTEKIGYIDIEKVFNEYKGTKRAKSELSEEIRDIKEEIMLIDKEIDDLEEKIRDKSLSLIEEENPSGDSEQENNQSDTATQSASESSQNEKGGGIAELREKIDSLRNEKAKLGNKLKTIKEDSFETDSKISHNIMGDIYDVVEEIALEEGYAIILNKKDIIYSRQDTDITEEAIKRLNEKFWK